MRLPMTIKIIAPLIVFFVIGFIAIKNVRAQVHVNNKAYDVTLSTLLSHSVNEVDVNEVANSKDIVLLDAREKNEYDVSHIEGAIWVGYDNFNLNRINTIPKDKNIIVYCSVGYRSEKIAEKIIADGYTNVSNLYGGIFEWVNTNHTVVNDSNIPTDSIHAYDKAWGVWLQRGVKVY
ncbi:MAG: rhodanese-like domain-containing protein [Chitinophagales bacterium]